MLAPGQSIWLTLNLFEIICENLFFLFFFNRVFNYFTSTTSSILENLALISVINHYFLLRVVVYYLTDCWLVWKVLETLTWGRNAQGWMETNPMVTQWVSRKVLNLIILVMERIHLRLVDTTTTTIIIIAATTMSTKKRPRRRSCLQRWNVLIEQRLFFIRLGLWKWHLRLLR